MLCDFRFTSNSTVSKETSTATSSSKIKALPPVQASAAVGTDSWYLNNEDQ